MTSRPSPAERIRPAHVRRTISLVLGAALAPLLAAGLLLVALTGRGSWVPYRPAFAIAVPLASLLVLGLALRARRAGGPAGPAGLGRVAASLALGLATAALAVSLAREARFRWIRHRVLTADPVRLARVGRHVVVGYRDVEELSTLIERRAVGGVFVTTRNVEGRAAAEIALELARFQELRRRSGEPPLWIAADQEGGRVSRLSPPLPALPGLAVVAAACGAPAGCPEEVLAHARRQARGLAALGVNLDFSPVVDLDHRRALPAAGNTRVLDRAIGSDPALVRAVAEGYCAALGEAGVACTLKHFPGLGRVREDTHRGPATLTASPAELAGSDWIPFGVARDHPGRFVMVAHARLAEVDPDRPASISHAVVGGLLRGAWGHDGPVITDDLGMAALAGSRWGVGAGSVEALTAGVDLLLVSWDPDLVYVALDALLRADEAGTLTPALLARSEARLARARRALPPTQRSAPASLGASAAGVLGEPGIAK